MGKGLSRSYIAMQAAIVGMMGSLGAVPWNSFGSHESIRSKAMRRLEKVAGGGRAVGHKSYKPHQGAKECERRRFQRLSGRATPNYVHGMQYDNR